MSEIILGASPESSYSLQAIGQARAGRSGWRRANAAAKRLFDLVVAIILLALLSPVLLLIALVIVLDTPGPVIYRGDRVGKDGKVFRMCKFRTMHECAESYQGPKITAQDDPRITRLGHWLRDTKLNELPQLWNVVRGEMSFVGPRPEDPDIVTLWPEAARQEILSLRPGITSPASVIYHDEESRLLADSLMDDYVQTILPIKLRLDRRYVQRCSLLSDIDIMLLTAVIMLPRLRDRPIPEHLLYWGPLCRFVSRSLSWFLVDCLVALACTALLGIAWRIGGPLNLGLGRAVGIASIIALIFSLYNALFGLNRIAWAHARAASAAKLGLSACLTTLSLMLINMVVMPTPLLPPGMLLATGFLALLGFAAARFRERLFTSLASRWLAIRRGTQSAPGVRTLVVSAPEIDATTTWVFQAFKQVKGLQIVGLVNDNPRQQGLMINDLKVLGTPDELPDLIDRNRIGVVLIAAGPNGSLNYQEITSLCEDKGVHVETIREVSRQPVFNRSQAAVPSPAADSPADLRWVTPDNLGRWLAEMEHLADAGDWSEMGIRIQDMKTQLAHYTKADRLRWQQPGEGNGRSE
jgi:lipopolysaccharide/colanic/teichoic acid biosynthesis glycosyltransferase